MDYNQEMQTKVVSLLQAKLPKLMAIYAFGSRIQNTASDDSDLDLAVLVEGYAEPLLLWELSNQLADLVLCSVDLLDFRAASTVMQYQILMSGQRWWAADSRASIYEAFVLSQKTSLDEARADLLKDIQKRGSIYGR